MTGGRTRPDRERVWLVTAVVAASVLTTAVAGVGPFLEPGTGRRLAGGAVLLVVLAAQALALAGRIPGGTGAGRRAAPLVALVLATAVSVPVLAPAGTGQGWETWAWVAAGVAGSAPFLIGWRAGAVAAVVLTAVSAVVGRWVAGDPVEYGVLTGCTAAGLMVIHLLPLRLWELVTEARAGRDAAARLAAAEERLRFAADVHDLLGHHLTVIALQAELAARTVHTAPDTAAGHAERARSLAATALAEMRRVVHGYRAVDLDAQLAAVAEVLRASGVRCTLDTAVPATLPAPVAEALAATAREAGTNVLRHSRARWCTIRLVQDTDGTELTIVNDGVTRGAPADEHSSGLRGLADRLAAAAGSLDTTVDDGVFTLRATVPVL
ncbi:histidine kinase [Pseudonocardia nematodicida]|uniref:Histidine kinase n=1 Tax=Pseudonocardia nematodicida TaxID=1206997 RepID=A0ABV1KI07_9PSEU